jgi:hypothetical protein
MTKRSGRRSPVVRVMRGVVPAMFAVTAAVSLWPVGSASALQNDFFDQQCQQRSNVTIGSTGAPACTVTVVCPPTSLQCEVAAQATIRGMGLTSGSVELLADGVVTRGRTAGPALNGVIAFDANGLTVEPGTVLEARCRMTGVLALQTSTQCNLFGYMLFL